MNLNTTGKNHSIYKSNLQSQLMSIFEVRSEFPLLKQSETFNERITPLLSFRLNPGQMKKLATRTVNVCTLQELETCSYPSISIRCSANIVHILIHVLITFAFSPI